MASTLNSNSNNGIEEELDFRKEVIYFIIVDRFLDGCPVPDKGSKDELFDPSRTHWGKYWGGDLKGIIEKADYLKSLGVTALWISPLFEQVDALRGEYTAMHGYWTKDFKRINPRFLPNGESNSLKESVTLKQLVDTLHAKGLKVILDIVCNHSSPDISGQKGVVTDDGEPLADFNNDHNNFYYHFPEITDWDDEFQLIHGEMAGLATFNEKNITYRNYIKSAMKNWLEAGFDAFRVDTLKHMPLWFWQEFVTDIKKHTPSTFLFGEYGFGKPWDERAVAYANQSGMSILDFGLCDGIRFAFSGSQPGGFHNVQKVLDYDNVYHRANELVTFIDNHDMPRFLSISDGYNLELATSLLMTLRGIPCIFYGTEQYLVNNTNEGQDPYNRPMMESWDLSKKMVTIIQTLSGLRRANPAIPYGSHSTKYLSDDIYAFTRKYRDSRCFTLINQGSESTISIDNTELPDGSHQCILSGAHIDVVGGRINNLQLAFKAAIVISVVGAPVVGKTVVAFQVNGYATEPGEAIAVIGDAPELGSWDFNRAYVLEYVNANTWFGEVPFEIAEGGRSLRYKFMVLKANSQGLRHGEDLEPELQPITEALTSRHCLLPESGRLKVECLWNSLEIAI